MNTELARPVTATRRVRQALAGVTLGLLGTAAPAAPGTIVKATGVYAKPFLDAPVGSAFERENGTGPFVEVHDFEPPAD